MTFSAWSTSSLTRGSWSAPQATGRSSTSRPRAASWPRALPRYSCACRRRSSRRRETKDDGWNGVDRGLFDDLRDLRRQIADERALPPFVVFSDAVLRDMARLRPASVEAMSTIKGIGDRKLADLGQRFVDAIKGYCREHGLTPGPSLSASNQPRLEPGATGPTAAAKPANPAVLRAFDGQTVVIEMQPSAQFDPAPEDSAVLAAVFEILDTMPDKRLSATMLGHVLRGSQGERTQEIIAMYQPPTAGAFADVPFLELRNSIIDAAAADGRLRITGQAREPALAE